MSDPTPRQALQECIANLEKEGYALSHPLIARMCAIVNSEDQWNEYAFIKRLAFEEAAKMAECVPIQTYCTEYHSKQVECARITIAEAIRARAYFSK